MLLLHKTTIRTTVLAAIAACGMTSDARALSAEDLEGVNIETAVTYAMRVKRPQGTFTPQVTMTMKFAVKDGVVVGTFTRSSESPAGKRTNTNKMHAPLGVVGKPPAGGEGRWSSRTTSWFCCGPLSRADLGRRFPFRAAVRI